MTTLSERDRWIKPDLEQFGGVTKEERRLAEKYTALRPLGNEWFPILVVGDQSWMVADCIPKEEAEWHCWMLAKALLKVVSNDQNL